MPESLLSHLPKPPEGKKGWPWTEETDPSIYQKGVEYPKISIVTPSYNQDHYIEETIRSILLQNYPNLEFIIIDGGSTDNTVEILEKYDPWISYWVSEKDGGQSDAINKGWQKATGYLIGWQNSDDIYLKNAFFNVLKHYSSDIDIVMYSGNVLTIDKNSDLLRKSKFIKPTFKRVIYEGFILSSQGVFWVNSLKEKIGMMDAELNHAMDMDLYLRILRTGKAVFVKEYIGAFRVYPGTKTSVNGKNGTIEFNKLVLNLGYDRSKTIFKIKVKIYRIIRLIKHFF